MADPSHVRTMDRPCSLLSEEPLMRRLVLALPLAAVLLVSPVPAFAQPWPVNPASDGAGQISQLFWFTLVLATIVFVLVEGLLIYSSLRFRRRAPLATVEPPQRSEEHTSELQSHSDLVCRLLL